MVDFTLIEPEYPRVGALILARVPSLTVTPEYERLGESAQDLPGLVASALAAYLGRLQSKELSGNLDAQESTSLAASYDLLEELASSSESEVRALLEDEVFENIRADDRTWAAFARHLGSKSSRVFQEWSKKNPRDTN